MKNNYWQKFEENEYYHIYNRANGKALLFEDDGNFRYFLEKWQRYLGNYVDTVAYCLMNNHFHFTVRIKTVDDKIRQLAGEENTTAGDKFSKNAISYNVFLEDQFRRLFQSYSISFNKQKQRHGSLFQPKFKRVRLVSIPRILEAIAYVHHNPLHHDYSPYYETWTYSSYKTYLSKQPTKLARTLGLSLFSAEARVSSDITDIEVYFKQYHDYFHKSWIKKQKWAEWEV